MFHFKYLLCCICLVFIYLCYFLYRKRKFYSNITSRLPTAEGLPFFGVVFDILPFKKFLYGISEQFEKFKTLTYCAWLGTEVFLITIEPEIIKLILTSEDFIEKAPAFYECVDHGIPQGLISSPGSKWRSHRKLMNPSYAHKVVSESALKLHRGSQTLSNEFENLTGKSVQVLDLIKRNIFFIAIETNMGFTMKEDHPEDMKFYNNFRELIENMAKDTVYSSLKANFIIRNKQYYRIRNSVEDYLARRISDQKLKNSKDLNSADIYLDRAVKLGMRGDFDVNDIISEAETVIAGSFETISTTLYSVLLLLAMHPEVQQELFEEISYIYNINTSTPDSHLYNAIKDMVYLDMVVKETLRLIPAIPVIGRETSKSITIKSNVELPGKMQVMLPIFSLHRSKKLWGPAADCFNPENFSSINVTNRHPYAYIPFSKGPRNCIGWHYGMIAVKVYLVSLLKKFKFSTNYKYEQLKFYHLISIRYCEEPALLIEKRL